MRRLLVALCAVMMLGGIAPARNRIAKYMEAADHVDHVDMGITLHVVRKDPVSGDELIPGLPRMTLVETIPLGGMVAIDADGARLSGPSENPVVWFASELQAKIILHEDGPLWALIEGSEGSNKTATLARWTAVQVLSFIGQNVEGGITAPTHPRMQHVEEEIRKWWSPSWYRWSERDKCYRFHCGPRVQLVSAVQRSKEAGSPIQGANWVFAAGDEFQDHHAQEPNIEMRLRTAQGRAKRLNTSTPKDASDWRNFRDRCKANASGASGKRVMWSVTKMLGRESPFISDDFWDSIVDGGTMTEREIRRRIDAEDVGPENQVYYCFARTVDGKPANLIRIPDDAVDVTAQILKRWAQPGQSIGLLIGHDPGKRQHVSVFLKAYRFRGQPAHDTRARWVVVDEVTTPESTILTHVDAVQRRVRERWRCNLLDRDGQPDGPIALVRVDPHTRSGTLHPGMDVYLTWRQHGFLTRAAFYKPDSTEPAVIKKEERINVVNTLLAAKVGDTVSRRLFVAVGPDGSPVAKKLVGAFESMQRNAAGEAEAEAKDADDQSHWPCAVGYAVYLVEHVNVGMQAAQPRAA